MLCRYLADMYQRRNIKRSSQLKKKQMLSANFSTNLRCNFIADVCLMMFCIHTHNPFILVSKRSKNKSISKMVMLLFSKLTAYNDQGLKMTQKKVIKVIHMTCALVIQSKEAICIVMLDLVQVHTANIISRGFNWYGRVMTAAILWLLVRSLQLINFYCAFLTASVIIKETLFTCCLISITV